MVEEVKSPEDCGSTFKWPNYWLLVSYHIRFGIRFLIVPLRSVETVSTLRTRLCWYSIVWIWLAPPVKDALQARKQCGPITPKRAWCFAHKEADMSSILSTLSTPLHAVFLSPSSARSHGRVRLHEGMFRIRLLLLAACRKSNLQNGQMEMSVAVRA